MSFIAGIIHLDYSTVYPESIESLIDSVGWDDFVGQTLVLGNAAFGYCHHPDRKPKAGIFRDKDLLVLADIRIYNPEKLLEFFCFDSPEEALAKAYRLWGTDCANHLNGDFAAMIYDRSKNAVHLLRDHIGTRPLVYHLSGHSLVFASHEFGLAKSKMVNPTLSEEKLIDTFFQFKEMYPQTVFENIRKVLPGHLVTINSGGTCRMHQYWKPEKIKKDKSLTFETAAARLKEMLLRATRIRMESGRTGLHVSGGLDSCSVASMVADFTPDKELLCGYSWSPEYFDEKIPGVNEKEYIEAFETDKDIQIRYLDLKKNETVKNALLPEFETQHIELPVMKMAQEDGIETLFSGWGGDEFVSLSTRGTVNHLFFSLKWKKLMDYCQVKGIKHTLSQFRHDVLPFLVPFGLLPVYKVQGTDWSTLKWFKPAFLNRHWKQIAFHKTRNFYGYGNRTKLSLNLLEMRHLPERMDSWTIYAERYGFEYKYPLLDKDVLEFWFSIPVEHTYRDFESRLLFREAMKGILTEKIRTRKDKGEALRLAYSFRERQKGKNYLKNLFEAIDPNEHLPAFRSETIKKVMNQPDPPKKMQEFRSTGKCILYLRYIALIKHYMTDPE